ncbi:hypothetical protein HY68_36860 [Streptomyces sp. AcH 505]|uniref:hypothetical protein n=1 Tax=Streptomyces sp. AcH 505 TaxID=352211 RepID=UPI000591B106|nr:hypothetical protein HY68_36860 [Streptomyces sp. AcH 505]
MADEPSLGELGRLIQAMRGDIRDDMAQINARLDRMVSTEVYAVEKAGLAKDISDLAKVVETMQQQRAQDADRVTQTRRYLTASVIIPILGLIVPFVFFILGGKG